MADAETDTIIPKRRQLAGFFLTLGCFTFGGPSAHIAVMQDQLVRKRRWISSADFLDLLAVSNILPGPTSTELAIYIGYRLRGLVGLLLAGICFIFPAFLLTAIIAWAYLHYGHLPAVAGVFYGVKPVVLVVVAQALWRLGKSAVKSRWLAVLGLLSLAACFAGVNLLVVLLGAATLAGMVYALRAPGNQSKNILPMMFPLALTTTAPAALGSTAMAIFLAFAKIGSIIFGSGYVLLAFLQSDLVDHRHWLTSQQLLDAIAVGQITPGPVFSTATFIGYIMAGPRGAVAATVGIFAPAFFFVAVTGPLIKWIRKSKSAGAALDGLNVASLALMLFVVQPLAKAAIVDKLTITLLIVSAVLLFWRRINPMILVTGGALAGVVAYWGLLIAN